MAERHALRDGVPKHALKLPFRGGTRARPRAGGAEDRRPRPASAARALNSNGADESIFLEPLIEIAQANQTPAERKLELFHGAMERQRRSGVPRVRVLSLRGRCRRRDYAAGTMTSRWCRRRASATQVHPASGICVRHGP